MSAAPVFFTARDLPRRNTQGLYAVELSDGLVKIGRSSMRRVRFQTMNQQKIVRIWFSAPHRNHVETEKRWIKRALRLGPVRGREWFRAPIEQLVALAPKRGLRR